MKLVEILARELEVWPEGAQELGQWPAGEICIRAASTGQPCTKVYESINIADDVDAWCTRPQWQAERDRMKAMGTFDKQALHDELRSRQGKRMPMPDCVEPEEPTYEQQLWDRAYADAWRHGFSVLGSDCSTEYFQSMTQASARMADAFMAERAKRVGK